MNEIWERFCSPHALSWLSAPNAFLSCQLPEDFPFGKLRRQAIKQWHSTRVPNLLLVGIAVSDRRILWFQPRLWVKVEALWVWPQWVQVENLKAQKQPHCPRWGKEPNLTNTHSAFLNCTQLEIKHVGEGRDVARLFLWGVRIYSIQCSCLNLENCLSSLKSRDDKIVNTYSTTSQHLGRFYIETSVFLRNPYLFSHKGNIPRNIVVSG